jgi:16S rRNA (guanine(966)-N(2))-methyltransferase RsmD
MRIIAGRLKGRRLTAPAGDLVRPTSDRLRETLFNVVGDFADGTRVLDGFAGTGALGIEAYSRGAGAITFIERDPKALRVLHANIEPCGIAEACAIIRGDFMTVRDDLPRFDLVLLDPPYRVDNFDAVLERGAAWLGTAGHLVLEHTRRRTTPERVTGAFRYRVLTAGDSALSFYAPA